MSFADKMKTPIDECEFFSWGEALWLSRWKIHAMPSAEIEKNIIVTAQRMSLIRKFLGSPLQITSWYRPDNYNEMIGGARLSQHVLGRACDFIVPGNDSDRIRDLLIPHLAEFNIRMENLPDSSWVHIDTACVPEDSISKRYFKP